MAEIRKVIVFDCSGPLGIQILQKAASHGLAVTAFTNRPDNIPKSISEQLHIVKGDVLDEENVEEALMGHDAVFCAIESYNMFSQKHVISQGCQNIVDGMKKHNIRKLALAGNACAMCGETGLFDRIRKSYGKNAEYVRMMDILKMERASIDWVVMMVPKLEISDRVNSEYKVGKNNVPGVWSVTTGETADFMVKVFMDQPSTEYFRHNSMGISSRPKTNFSSVATYTKFTAGLMTVVFAILAYHRQLPSILQRYIDQITNLD